MTETKRPQRYKPRGQGADDVQVEIYRMLYNADKPMTFDEIAAGINPAYKHDAFKAYRDSGLPQARWLGLIDGEWPDELKREAWEWWVAAQLAVSVHVKRLVVKAERPIQRAPLREKTWTANRDKPPMVSVTVWEEVKRLVPWTPNIGKAGVRHTKKRRYLNANDEVMALTDRIRDKALAKQLREHMADGAEALDDSRGD